MRDVTVALGVGNNIELLRNFYTTFRKHHPDVPISFGALQLSKETVGYLKSLEKEDELLTVAYGNPKDGHHVSFSENFNAAINNVKTSKLVLGHTDIIFCDNFFDVLEREMSEDNFYIYTTVEPPIYVEHRRPGKTIGDFGESFEKFDHGRFEQYVKVLQSKPDLHKKGYGFFLAGYKKNFEDVGGYDMLMFNPCFCEDDDFCVRVREKGYYMVVLDHAITYHFVSQTARSIQKTVTASETEMNRRFAKKWGFEARFLWGIGYWSIEEPFKIYSRSIQYRLNGAEDPSDVLNIEVLATPVPKDSIYPGHIEICYTKPGFGNFTDFASLVGTLRLQKNLEPGTYNYRDYQVKVNVATDDVIEDTHNYLSLQKSIEYE